MLADPLAKPRGRPTKALRLDRPIQRCGIVVAGSKLRREIRHEAIDVRRPFAPLRGRREVTSSKIAPHQVAATSDLQRNGANPVAGIPQGDDLLIARSALVVALLPPLIGPCQHWRWSIVQRSFSPSARRYDDRSIRWYRMGDRMQCLLMTREQTFKRFPQILGVGEIGRPPASPEERLAARHPRRCRHDLG